MDRRRLRTVLAAAAVVGVAAVLATGLTRVHDGEVALDGVRVRTAGWLWHLPFGRIVKVANPAHVSLPAVAWRSREGSTLEFGVDVDFTFATGVAPQLAEDTRASGLEGAIHAIAQHVLDDAGRRTDAETLLSSPSVTEVPLRAALEAAGLQVSRLTFRSRVGDDLIRRTKTEEARRLARPAQARILVVGWDGADWDLADPLMAEGRMPFLARLVSEGARADLRSYDPMFSPLLWTTVATGKPPTEHGIADFLVRDAASKNRRPITSDFRKVKALWNILSDFDRPSAWIAWWASYPAEPVRGLMLTDYLGGALATKSPEDAAAMPGVMSPPGALHDPQRLVVRASQITRDEVAGIIPLTDADYRAAEAEIAKAPEKPEGERGGTQNPVAFVIRVLAVSRTYHNIAMAQLREGLPFVAIYYEGVDMMGHGFQHYLPPKLSFVSKAEYDRYHDAVTNYYQFQDRLLGELLAAAGPDTITVVLSDHGFRTGEGRPNFAPSTKGQPEEWHRDWGILAMHGPGIRPGPIPPASIYDVAPTLLYLAGLPLADDMPGRLVTAAFLPTVLSQRPPAHVKSYELVGERLEHTAAQQADPAAMKEMMANLRALGYVGGADNDTTAGSESPATSAATASAPETQYFYHRNLAVSYIRQGRLQEAEAELLLANERKPQGKTYEMLSQVRAQQGRYREASAALEQGLETVPKLMDPGTPLWLVELDLLAGDPDAARGVAARFPADLTDAVRLAIDGRLKDAAGDREGATADYRRALQSDPLLVRIAQRLHELDIARGEPFAIEPFLVETLASHPLVDAYWDMAGQLAAARGAYGIAEARFRKATSIQPDDGLFLGHLASALAAGGKTQEARSSLAWAERFPPDESDAWMAIGSAWDRLGETDRALAAFRSAKSAGLKGPEADVGSALTLARAGRLGEARQVIAQAAAAYPESRVVQQVKERLGR